MRHGNFNHFRKNRRSQCGYDTWTWLSGFYLKFEHISIYSYPLVFSNSLLGLQGRTEENICTGHQWAHQGRKSIQELDSLSPFFNVESLRIQWSMFAIVINNIEIGWRGTLGAQNRNFQGRKSAFYTKAHRSFDRWTAWPVRPCWAYSKRFV